MNGDQTAEFIYLMAILVFVASAFVGGAVLLMVMWIIFAIRILSGPWPA